MGLYLAAIEYIDLSQRSLPNDEQVTGMTPGGPEARKLESAHALEWAGATSNGRMRVQPLRLKPTDP
jgi:hypothetical protein